MNKKVLYSIGLMSGTSLDGLDIVYVRFDCNGQYRFNILYKETILYTDFWREKLRLAVNQSDKILEQMSMEYGAFLGRRVKEFIDKYSIADLDFIASHGHTVFHQPNKGITLQIGDGQTIANVTNCKVVCDFRTQDVELGGQGAPLVPIGDRLLFAEYDACVNLGGFANISFEEGDDRLAYDICPVNIVLNDVSRKLGFEYDEEGKIASTGEVNKGLLDVLNSLEFYKKSPPKSLGLEWVQKTIFPLFDDDIKKVDLLRTFVEHIAIQITNSIQGFETVLFTGGGVFNTFLVERIKHYTTSKIQVPEATIVNYKEALIFSLLGLLRLENKDNCLSSVTGAKKNHSSGRIFNPNNS